MWLEYNFARTHSYRHTQSAQTLSCWYSLLANMSPLPGVQLKMSSVCSQSEKYLRATRINGLSPHHTSWILSAKKHYLQGYEMQEVYKSIHILCYSPRTFVHIQHIWYLHMYGNWKVLLKLFRKAAIWLLQKVRMNSENYKDIFKHASKVSHTLCWLQKTHAPAFMELIRKWNLQEIAG